MNCVNKPYTHLYIWHTHVYIWHYASLLATELFTPVSDYI